MNRRMMLDLSAFQRGYLSLLVKDIPETLMTAQFPGVPNHPTWHLGHLAVVYDGMTGMLGGAKTLDDSWQGRYGMGSTPVADASAYPTKAEIVRIYDERREALLQAFDVASPERFMSANPIPSLVERLPTIGHMTIFAMLTHESMHLGQIAVWRNAAGLGQVLRG